MSLISWLRSPKRTKIGQGRRIHGPSRQRSTFRPRLEALENRTLLSTYYAATASDLIADINAANAAGGANTIVLTAPTTSPYVLTAVNNVISGPTNPIKKKVSAVAADNLTILTGNGSANPGFGDILDASKHGRLFDVASGASLTLENVTLQNGFANYNGGAIYNQGTLALNQVLIQNNTAQGWPAAGGGIWSNGSLTVKNSTFESNVALAGTTSPAFGGAIYIAGGTVSITGSAFGNPNGGGGNMAKGNTAYGGALYVSAGAVTLSGDSFGLVTYGFNGFSDSGNSAVGGVGGLGDGYGGAVYVAGGTVTLTNDYIEGNYVEDISNLDGVYYGDYGGYGGGIYIASGATVYMDSFTVGNTVGNISNGGDIWGGYILLS
jgi:hypothetical protein